MDSKWKLVCVSMVLAAFVGCAEETQSPVEPTAELHLVPGHHAQTFFARLSGSQEVPPVDTDGHGFAQFLLSPDETKLHFRVSTFGVENITQSHIHLAAAGANGPVVAFLFGFVAEGVTPHGLLATGTLKEEDLIPRTGFDGTMAALVERIRSGGAYVNVHTIAYPPGEVRGQIGSK